MRIYDISKEMLHAEVYPGDSPAAIVRVASIADGDGCNLSDLHCCVHNGTHMDAPLHFVDDGADITGISPERFIGYDHVVSAQGMLNAAALDALLPAGCRRVLFHGATAFTEDGARLLAERVLLAGVEAMTIGDAEVHRILLSRNIAVLESIRLDGIADGRYFLCAAPVAIHGSDGAPVRAFLISDFEENE